MKSSVTYRCLACRRTTTAPIGDETNVVTCEFCEAEIKTNEKALADGTLQRCLVCPCKELFLRKDFPQRLGVTIVTIGFAISCITWYYHWLIATFAVLFATALIDVLLYLLMGEVVECYRCHAQYRGTGELTAHESFDLEVHERHRQQLARAAQLRK